MYSATKVHIILHEAPLGTIVHGVYSLWCGTVATCDIEIFELLVPGAFSLSTTTLNSHSQLFHRCREYGFLASWLKDRDAHALRQA